MRMIKLDQLKALSLGAAILGSGGGSATITQERIVRFFLKQKVVINLLELGELNDDDLIIPLAFMGAPLVAMEKLPTGLEADHLIETIRDDYPGRRLVLMPAEIGGANAFTPLWIAARHRLPVLDADSIGRAFPKLNMSVLNLAKISSNPAYISGIDGGCHRLDCEDAMELERQARKLCVAMGSRALAALYLLSGSIAKSVVVAGSISRAIDLGKALLEGLRLKENPAAFLAAQFDGQHIASGTIEAVDHRIEGGFLKGIIRLNKQGERLNLRFINEFIAVEKSGELIAMTPAILTLLEQETGKPVSTAEAKWGLKVELLALPAPAVWSSEEGLQLVGLKAMEVETCAIP